MTMKNPYGFTLIETLIYSFLLSFIIVGALVGIYQIISSADKLTTKAFIEQEGNFLLRKINWAITGATNLSVDLDGNLNLEKPDIGFLQFKWDPVYKKIQLNRNGEWNDLNSDYVKVSDTNFSYDDSTYKISASFTLSDYSENINKNFEIVKYLRK